MKIPLPITLETTIAAPSNGPSLRDNVGDLELLTVDVEVQDTQNPWVFAIG